MGFTITRTSNADYATKRTPEQEAIDKLNHDRTRKLEAEPPIAIGTEKQIIWATSIAANFLYYAHAAGFKAEELEMFFEGQGKYAKFWIDHRPAHRMGGELKIAVRAALDAMHRTQEVEARAEQTIASLTPAQLAKKIGR